MPEHLAYGEIEYRGTVTRNGLLGVVAFLNTTSVDNEDAGKKLFADFAPAAGFGLRVLLNKHSRTNLTADYGWGKAGSRGLYLGIQEAFQPPVLAAQANRRAGGQSCDPFSASNRSVSARSSCFSRTCSSPVAGLANPACTLRTLPSRPR